MKLGKGCNGVAAMSAGAAAQSVIKLAAGAPHAGRLAKHGQGGYPQVRTVVVK